MSRFGLVLVTAAFTTATAVDQYSLVLPQTLFQPIGSSTALQAGATYASGDEAAAGWYNPANLSWITGGSVSASANAYGLSGVEFDAGKDSSRLIGGTIFKYYGGYLDAWPPGEEQPRADAPRFALVFANPMSWSARVDSGRPAPTASEPAYGTHISMAQRTWGAAAMMSWRMNARASLGLGLVGLLDQLDLYQSSWRHEYGGRYDSVSQSLYQWSASLRPAIGTRWQTTTNLAIGLALQLAPIEVANDGSAAYAATRTTPSGAITTAAGRNDDNPFRFVHPPEIGLGLAWKEASWQVELSTVYLLPPSEHTTISSTPITLTVNQPDGSLTTSNTQLAAKTTAYRHILNWRLGGRCLLTNNLTLHGGVFYDKSPVESSEVYDQLDFIGGSVGLTLQRGHSIFTLGVNASTSNHADITTYDLSTDSLINGTLHAWTLDALIGTGYRF